MTTLIFLFLVLVLGLLYVACGLGLYLLIGCNYFSRFGTPSIALCAAFGFAVLGWTSTWVFYLGFAANCTIWISLLLSFGFALIAYRTRGREIGSELLSVYSLCRKDIDLIVASFVVVLFIFIAGFQGSIDQPFRVGIDAVGYGTTAGYLQAGGGKVSIETEVIKSTEQANLSYGLNAHLTMVSFRSSVTSEFLLKAHRFGYPMVLAAISQFFGLEPVVRFQFLFLAVPMICACFLMFWFCSDLLGMPQNIGKAIALTLLLNCNQLIVLYEGQHAQIAILPFIVLFFGLFYKIRDAFGRPNSIDFGRNYWVLIVVGMGIFEFYSESLIALGCVGVLVLLLDVIFWDRRAVCSTLLFALMVLIGMLMLGGYFIDWIGFMVRNLRNVGAGNGGFWQPYWAYPSEILGYASIYTEMVPRLLVRTFESDFVGMSLSVLVCLIALSSGFASKRERVVFWLAPVVVCFMVYVRSTLFNDFINYGYYKTYTMLLVPILVFHLGSLYHWIARVVGSGKRGNWFVMASMYTAVSAMFIVGLLETFAYSREAKYVPRGSLELRDFDRKFDLSSYVILTYPAGGIDLALLGGYFDFNWLNLGWSDLRLRPVLDKEILVMVVKGAAVDFESLNRSSKVIFRSGDIVVLRTGRMLREFKEFDVNVIADKPTLELKWPHVQPAVFSGFLSRFLDEIQIDSTQSQPAK